MYLSQIGRTGGERGVGPSKRRSKEHYLRIQALSVAKRLENKNNPPPPKPRPVPDPSKIRDLSRFFGKPAAAPKPKLPLPKFGAKPTGPT